MGKDCTTVYYDRNGKKSDTYYGTLEKTGNKDMALTAYINEMAYEVPTPRFSSIAAEMFRGTGKADDADGYVEESRGEQIEKQLRKKFTREEMIKKGYAGVTTIIEEELSNGIPEPVKRRAAVKAFIRDLARINNKDLKNDYKELQEEANRYFGLDPENNPSQNEGEFELYMSDVQNLYIAQRDLGTLQHSFIESMIDEMNNNPTSNLTNWFIEAKEKFVAENGYVLNDQVLQNLKRIFKDILKEKKFYEEEYGAEFHIIPEAGIVTSKMMFDNKPLQGHIDIMLYSPKLNKAVLYDIKTKSEQSFANFEFDAAPPMRGALGGLKDNASNHVAVQLGTYKKGLELQYDTEVLDTKVVLITGIYDYKEGEEGDAGNREWHVIDAVPESTMIKKIVTPDGAINNLFEIKKKKPLGEAPDQIIQDLFDGKLAAISKNPDEYANSQEALIVKDKRGKYVWTNSLTRERLTADTIDALKKKIKQAYIKLQKMKKHSASHLIELFETGKAPKGSIWDNNLYKEKALTILSGITPESHQLYSASSLPELDGTADDVLVIEDKRTGEFQLISLSASYNNRYSFNEEGQMPRTSVLGPWLTDETVKKEYGGDIVPDADTHTLSNLRLALIAADLKAENPNRFKTITKLRSITLFDNTMAGYQTNYMKEQIGLLKEIRKAMETAKIEVPEAIKTVTEDEELSSPDSYSENYLEEFINRLKDKEDPLFMLAVKSRNKAALSVRKKLLKASAEMTSTGMSAERFYEIEKEFMQYLKQTFWAIKGSFKGNTYDNDQIYRDPQFVAVNRAFLEFKNMMITENPNVENNFFTKLNTLTTINDQHAEVIHQEIAISEQRARDEIAEFMFEHQKLQRKLIESSKDVGIVGRVLTGDQFKKVYGPMLEDGYAFDPDDTSKWMKFKDPDKNKDDDSYLTKEQREYIRFYNKMVKKYMKILNPRAQKILDGTAGLKMKGKFDKGSIPIIPASSTTELQETMSLRGGTETSLTAIWNAMKRWVRRSEEERPKESDPWGFRSIFTNQVDAEPGRGSRDTRKLLKITDDNKVYDDSRNIELNPSMVLNIMAVEAARREHMHHASNLAISMDAELAYKQLDPTAKVEGLREVITDIVKMRIHNEFKKEGKLGEGLDIIKKLASIGIFGGSVRQFFTEAGTSGLQMVSTLLSNTVNKTLFGGDTKFGVKDLSWSGKHAVSAFGRQIMTDYGLYNSSLGQFTEDEFVETRNKSLWQTKHAFAHIHTVLRQSVQSVILAQMHKDGVTEKAFTMNDKGRWIYDETKDKRFYVWDPENDKLENQQPKAPETEEEIRKWELWKAHREEMIKDGGIKDGKMARPYTVKHLQSLKHYAVRMFGAMDSSQLIAYERSAVGRALVTFKKWGLQKFKNYWTRTEMSKKEGAWVLQEDGKYDFVATEFEGMINSFVGLAKDIFRLGWSSAMDASSDLRKQNVAKLLTDLLLFALLILAVMKLLKESLFAETALGSDIIRGFENAVMDMMPLLALKSFIDGSPVAAVSVAGRVVDKAMTSIWYVATGDIDKSLNEVDNMMSTFGLYRTAKGLVYEPLTN